MKSIPQVCPVQLSLFDFPSPDTLPACTQPSNKNIGGIYGIIHTSTSRIYVGSTANIAKRWKDHIYRLTIQDHPNPYLQHAWDKYGPDTFEWIIIEEIADPHQLIHFEQKWIGFYQATQPSEGFNLKPAFRNGRLGTKETTEQCEQKSIRRKNKRIATNAKLTEEQVRVIKGRLARGDFPSAIAPEYNVNTMTINAIKQGKNWKHIADFTPLSGEPKRPLLYRNLLP